MDRNRSPDIPASTLWETLKAYIRGEIISYVAYENKQKKDRLSVLTCCIAQLDDIYAIAPAPDIYKERLILQAEFDTLLADQITNLLTKSRSTYYEQGDRASRLLAHELCQMNSSHQISNIRTSSGTTLDPKEINEQFKRQSLYTSETETNLFDLDHFFSTPDCTFSFQ